MLTVRRMASPPAAERLTGDIMAASADIIATRPVRDADGGPVARLIAACFAEHEGVLYLAEEFPELAAPASWYEPKGTRMWVAEQAGEIVGCICGTPRGEAEVELHKFYVAARLRGSGLADRLFGLVEGLAREAGARRIVLWSDVKFTRAHRYYARRGFVASGETRALGDASNTVERFFSIDLDAEP